MRYIIILFLTLILINIFINYYYIKNRENFQLQPSTIINTLEEIQTLESKIRYVRIETDKTPYLSLAEVQVFEQKTNKNVALKKPTSQSSTGYGGLSSKANDGNTKGHYMVNKSVSHTNNKNPWWEVDLQNNYNISKIVIYNRTDCCQDRLDNCVIKVLDENRNILKSFEYGINKKIKTFYIDSYTVFNINQLVKFNNTSINGFVMNGVNSYIQFNNKLNDIFTLSLLFNTRNANKNQIIFDSNILTIGINNKKLFYKYESNDLLEYENEIKPNITYHLSIIFNKNELIFNVNGNETKMVLLNINLTEILFGISKELEESFFGILGEIKIFNDALSKEELCVMYNKCITYIISEEDNLEQQKNIDNYKEMLKQFTMVSNKCQFNPNGKTLLACKDRCSSKDRTKWGGDSCTIEKCEEICKECDDVELCRWKKETKEYLDFLNKPKAIFIKGYPLNGKIKLTWITPVMTDITDYYLSISEMSNPALRINFVSKSENGLNEFTIINLKNNIQYEITLYSRNKYGISPPSNNIKIIPLESKQEENPKTILDVSEDNINSVYKADGQIESTTDISNEYSNVIDFIKAQQTYSNEFNLDFNFK